MTRRLRTLLLCLLMAALPLQGLAAVMQASCGPAHHGVSTVVANDSMQHDHAADTDVHAMHMPGSADAVSDADPAQKSHANATCSACAACCSGATAPPNALFSGAPDAPSTTALPSPASLLTGTIPAGLERPPKSTSI